MSSDQEITVTHNAERGRYEARVGGSFAGFAGYNDEDGVRDFNHTVTAPEFSGRGVAAAVVRTALDDTVRAGLKILPTCTYVQAFVKKNHDWDGSLA